MRNINPSCPPPRSTSSSSSAGPRPPCRSPAAPRGDIVICEVKSGIEDYRVDRKWGEYGPYCDAFYFAVAPEFPSGVLPGEPGLIVADGFGGAVVREAPPAPLAPARRRALTLAFARLGALRTLRDQAAG